MGLFKEKLELKIEEAEFKARTSLSGFPSWQKWILIFCLLAALPAYFISKAVAKVYYQNNYEEYLVTAHPSFTDPKTVIIDRVDVATVGGNQYAAVLQLINPNLDLSAKNIRYEMKFLGGDGDEVAISQKGTLFLLPNQRKYLIAPNITAANPIATVELLLDEKIQWQKKLELPEVEIITSQPRGADRVDPYGYVLEGNISNNSAYFIKEVGLTFLLYGAGGKVIGASQRSEFDLKPLERRTYTQIWSGISGRNVVKAEAIAETNLLDKENLTVPASPTTGSGAGGLGR
jgi:hypothetical protein